MLRAGCVNLPAAVSAGLEVPEVGEAGEQTETRFGRNTPIDRSTRAAWVVGPGTSRQDLRFLCPAAAVKRSISSFDKLHSIPSCLGATASSRGGMSLLESAVYDDSAARACLAISASLPNVAASRTATSANILRLIWTPAFSIPPMNVE